MSEQDQAQAPETQFVLQRIYVKDLSFESPKSPDAFLQQWKPQINLEMNVSHNVLSDDNYEVVLSLTITARNEAEEAVYLVELQQAGIFLVRGQMLALWAYGLVFVYTLLWSLWEVGIDGWGQAGNGCHEQRGSDPDQAERQAG